MKYKKDFHNFQKQYIEKYPTANTMRNILINQVSLKNKKILDIGCGSGIDLQFFNEHNAKCFGIDISPELVEIGKKELPTAEIIKGTFNYLPWKNDMFDVVWSKYALQHEKDINFSINEIYRVLKNNGTAFIQVTHPMRTAGMISTNNYFNNGELVNYATIDGKIINEYHHSLTEWIQTIISNGFSIVSFQEILNRPIDQYSGVISPSATIFILKKQE